MEILVFARSGDPYSDMLRNLLKYHSLEYENIEVSNNPDAFRRLLRISGQPHTPVLVVDGKVYVGFDFHTVKQILGLTEDKAQ